MILKQNRGVFEKLFFHWFNVLALAAKLFFATLNLSFFCRYQVCFGASAVVVAYELCFGNSVVALKDLYRPRIIVLLLNLYPLRACIRRILLL